jgi:hypothetical protein
MSHPHSPVCPLTSPGCLAPEPQKRNLELTFPDVEAAFLIPDDSRMFGPENQGPSQKAQAGGGWNTDHQVVLDGPAVSLCTKTDLLWSQAGMLSTEGMTW